MLLLPDHDNWVMEWNIREFVHQCPVKISVICLLSCFALLYPWLKNIFHQLQIGCKGQFGVLYTTPLEL